MWSSLRSRCGCQQWYICPGAFWSLWSCVASWGIGLYPVILNAISVRSSMLHNVELESDSFNLWSLSFRGSWCSICVSLSVASALLQADCRIVWIFLVSILSFDDTFLGEGSCGSHRHGVPGPFTALHQYSWWYHCSTWPAMLALLRTNLQVLADWN